MKRIFLVIVATTLLAHHVDAADNSLSNQPTNSSGTTKSTNPDLGKTSSEAGKNTNSDATSGANNGSSSGTAGNVGQ
jgi:hypothetical protein